MCSIEILAANSCYLDDFSKVFAVIVSVVSAGIIFGTIVGILKRSIDN